MARIEPTAAWRAMNAARNAARNAAADRSARPARPHGLRGDAFLRYVVSEWAKEVRSSGDERAGLGPEWLNLLTLAELTRLGDILEAEHAFRDAGLARPFEASKTVPETLDLERHMRELPRSPDLDLPGVGELHPDRPKLTPAEFGALYVRSTPAERKALMPVMTLDDIEVCQAIWQAEIERMNRRAQN